MLASRLAAFDARKLSMLASSRPNACTSRTPAMLCCRSALTLPIETRVRRNALRAWSENHHVATIISGMTLMLTSA